MELNVQSLLFEFQKGSDDSIVMVLNYIIFLNFMGFVLFLCLFVCLFVKVSLCSPSCSETVLKLRSSPASASQMLGLKGFVVFISLFVIVSVISREI